MQHFHYPAIYKSASDLSLASQEQFFRALFGHMTLLLVAAVISVVNSQDPLAAILQSLTLLGALACAIYLFLAKPDRHWYSARALAESVKTSTWRFIAKAEPFDHADDQDRRNFLQKLKQILELNKDVVGRLSTHLDESQITSEMERVRRLSTEERQTYYRDARVLEQLTWYAHKAKFNQRRATWYYWGLFGTIFCAIVLALCRIRFPSTPYWPTDAFVTLAASLLSWIQAKRFQELAVSYALTAHEISFIRQQASAKMTESEFSQFVGDAEMAFSREHTQWTARRDA